MRRRTSKPRSSGLRPNELPFVVAINMLEWYTSDDIIDALYGEKDWVVDTATHEARMRGRKRNRAFMQGGGLSNTTASAVPVGYPVQRWNLAVAPMRLYLYPFAALPCGSTLTQLHHVIFEPGEPTFHQGRSIADVLALPPDWPQAGVSISVASGG